MYDWNHNDKHDTFDDAMFMALLDDDLRRHPPKKPRRRKHSTVSFRESMGCVFYGIFLIFAPLYTAFQFFMYGEGALAWGAIILGVLLNIGVYILY